MGRCLFRQLPARTLRFNNAAHPHPTAASTTAPAMKHLKNLMKALASTALLAGSLCGSARADIVNIDASQSGCVNVTQCDGSPHQPVGTVIGDLLAPAQLTLAAGTYTITNANGLPGANPAFTAWRFNGGDNWVWSFMVVDDATKKLLVQGCCGSAVFGSQAAAASDTFAQTYNSTLTLAATTKLDFITEDYYPYDNAGGVSLRILPAVPEPHAWALMLAGLVGLGAVRRRTSTASLTH